MKTFTNPLDKIHVASPCAANWDEMVGDQRKRFCSECELNVYNLSGMTRAEAENLLLTSENRVCVRFYRRRDGSVLTQDCPVGWQAVKRRVSRTATAFVSMCAGIFAGIFGFSQLKNAPPKVNECAVQFAKPPSFTQASKSYEAADIDDGWMGKPAILGDVDLLPIAGMPINYEEVRTDIKKKRGR